MKKYTFTLDVVMIKFIYLIKITIPKVRSAGSMANLQMPYRTITITTTINFWGITILAIFPGLILKCIPWELAWLRMDLWSIMGSKCRSMPIWCRAILDINSMQMVNVSILMNVMGKHLNWNFLNGKNWDKRLKIHIFKILWYEVFQKIF